jgi:ribosomal protein S18 acetylase RimI-like enzyme
MCEFEIKVDPLNNEESNAIALLHSQSINLGFLSQLGNSFLSYLYKSLSECEGSVLIVAKKEGDIIGFVSGSFGLGPVYKHLVKNHFIGVVLAIIPNMFSLTKIKRILEILFYSWRNEGDNSVSISELLSLAVREDFRNAGVATKLFQELIMRYKKDGVEGVKIIVGEELLGAQKFYEKMGAVKIGVVHVHKGAKSFIYRLAL